MYIIDLTLPELMWSKFWKSKQNWSLCSRIQYYIQGRYRRFRVYSPLAAIQDAVIGTSITLYDLYCRSDFFKSNQNWWLCSRIWYNTQGRKRISQVCFSPAALQHIAMYTPNNLYDTDYGAGSCKFNTIKTLKIQPELMAVQPDLILYSREKKYIPGVFAACSYTACSDVYTK